jgi:hypothetical protein
MGTPEQDLRQYEEHQERDDALEAIRAARVAEMMEDLRISGESVSFDTSISFSDVVEALDAEIDDPLHAVWTSGDNESVTALRDVITMAAVHLCWMAARNDITHQSLKEEREFSRAEDRSA